MELLRFVTASVSRLAALSITLAGGTIMSATAVGADCVAEYPVNVTSGITTGPDGNLWFTEAERIGRMTPTGIVTRYGIPTADSDPFGITTGPDGNLWFTARGANKIGKVTPTGTFTEYVVPTANSGPTGITSGPDGNLWFTELGANQIGKVTTSGTFTEYPIPTANSYSYDITTGPDGNLWFTQFFSGEIGKVTTSGTFTEYPIPTANSGPLSITAGPDGSLWFTELGANQIGKVTTSGTFTEYPIPTANSRPAGITAGPDGNLWFTEQFAGQIGKVSTSGVFTEYGIPTAFSGPISITAGPDGNLWFTEQTARQIGRIDPTAATPSCAVAPVAGCRTPAIREQALLILEEQTGDPQKNKLLWKWRKGSATLKADYSSPLTTTDYLLCIYDGASTLIGHALAPSGPTCGWSEIATGFKYKNNRTPEGLAQILLKEGLTGKAKIIVKGKGANLVMPSIPVSQPITVQLVNSDGECWEATYSAPAIKNTAGPPGQFKDKAD